MIKDHITDFNESLIVLRDFIEVINPFLNEKASKAGMFVQPVLMIGVIDDMFKTKDMTTEEKKRLEELKIRLNEKLSEIYSEVPKISILRESNENHTGANKRANIKINIQSSNKDFGSNFEIYDRAINHINLLHTSALTSALSTVEWYFSQLLHFHYDKYPNSASIHKRTLTLSELKDFESIGDAEKYLIDVKIDEILRGSFESWVGLLKNDLNLNLGYLSDNFDQLIEIYQRRNLFVHNGGVVNSIYLAKVNQNYKKNLKVGDALSVEKGYIDDAISKLQLAFILIGAELWKKIQPDDTNRAIELINIAYENLLHGRWDIAEGISFFIMKDSKCSPPAKVIAQLNYWLCYKETDRFREVEEDVNNADFSDKSLIFRLALLSLKEDDESFFEILPLAFDSKGIDVKRLEEYPIFRPMRETERYQLFKKNSPHFKNDTPEIDEKE